MMYRNSTLLLLRNTRKCAGRATYDGGRYAEETRREVRTGRVAADGVVVWMVKRGVEVFLRCGHEEQLYCDRTRVEGGEVGWRGCGSTPGPVWVELFGKVPCLGWKAQWAEAARRAAATGGAERMGRCQDVRRKEERIRVGGENGELADDWGVAEG